MKYMGSKSRIAKHIAPIIQSYVDASPGHVYVEPFCGGCNVIDHIHAERRIGSDKQKYLIALLQNLDRISELPDAVIREHYASVRDCYNNGRNDFPDWYIGAIGFLASYNGRFFDGGYAGIITTKTGVERNYYAEAKRNLEAQIPQLKGVEFFCSDYSEFDIPNGSVIYCDPPYKGTKQYGVSRGFDHDAFWEWARNRSKHNVVLISEHSAPEDFVSLWDQDIKRTIDHNKRVATVERLFIRREADST